MKVGNHLHLLYGLWAVKMIFLAADGGFGEAIERDDMPFSHANREGIFESIKGGLKGTDVLPLPDKHLC